MKLYLIRHGETAWNLERRLQGGSDIPLSEQGRRLALLTGEALRSVPFDLAFTSPLSRARETALCVLGDRHIPLLEDPRIAEISFGIYEGLSCAKDHYTIPDPDFMNFFQNPAAYIPPKGAESISALCARTTAFLQELISNPDYEDKTILISTHGAAMMGLLSSVHQRAVAQFWGDGVHKNCGVTILSAHHGQVTLEEENKIYYE